MKTFVNFLSGGVGSWAAGRRVAARLAPGDRLVNLFTDTNIEDPDLYRFLKEAAESIGGEFVWITNDGRTPWDVFREVRFLGNTRVAACSHELKQKPARRWLEENLDPATTVLVLGIDWTEEHRLGAVHAGYAHEARGCQASKLCRSLFSKEGRLQGPGCAALLEVPWRVEAPLTEAPLHAKARHLKDLEAEGIEVPRLYRLGFPHNNCGGGCVKAGQAQFRHLGKELPEVYAEWAAQEEGIRSFLGKDVAILRDRRGGTTKPLPLSEFAQREDVDVDLTEWGGCGCFVDA